MQLGLLDNVMNIGPVQADNCHGRHNKSVIVLHETVSPDYPGWSDIISVSQYLDNKDYGIHGIVDLEGHAAWASGDGTCIFYHTSSNGGFVNTRSMGIELVSRVMLAEPDNYARWRAWWRRNEQIEAVAKMLAWGHATHGVPLSVSDGSRPGITTHWQVTQRYHVVGGHTDCWPRHLGGYFPLLRIIERAKAYSVQMGL